MPRLTKPHELTERENAIWADGYCTGTEEMQEKEDLRRCLEQAPSSSACSVPGLIRPPLAQGVVGEESSGAHSAPAMQCEWSEDADGIWHTSCGHAWFFDTGTPEENEARWCIYCGAPLKPLHCGPGEDNASGASGG